MEVVLRPPRRIGPSEPAGPRIGQRAQTTGAGEHEVDRRGVEPEVGQDQDRHVGGDRLQGRRRRHRDEPRRIAQRLPQRSAAELELASRET